MDIHEAAAARRQAIQDHAASIGIDDAYVSVMVDTFYERVRANPDLAPIFMAAIPGDWTAHLARMKEFWASVAYNAGRYSGQPVPVHKRLEGVERRHFDIWLGLFRENLDATAPTEEAADYLMERANRIAQSLQLAIFGVALRDKRPD